MPIFIPLRKSWVGFAVGAGGEDVAGAIEGTVEFLGPLVVPEVYALGMSVCIVDSSDWKSVDVGRTAVVAFAMFVIAVDVEEHSYFM